MDPRQDSDSQEEKDKLYRVNPITVETIKESRLFNSFEVNCLESFPDLTRMDSSSLSFQVLFNDFFQKYGIHNTGFYKSTSTEEEDKSTSKAKRPSGSIPVDKTVGIVTPEFEYGSSELSEPNSSTRKTKDWEIVTPEFEYGSSELSEPNSSTRKTKDWEIVTPEFEYASSELSEPNSSTRKTKDWEIVMPEFEYGSSELSEPNSSTRKTKDWEIVTPEFEYGSSELSEPNSSTRKTKDLGIENQGVYLGTDKGLKYDFETRAGKIENYAFPSSGFYAGLENSAVSSLVPEAEGIMKDQDQDSCDTGYNSLKSPGTDSLASGSLNLNQGFSSCGSEEEIDFNITDISGGVVEVPACGERIRAVAQEKMVTSPQEIQRRRSPLIPDCRPLKLFNTCNDTLSDKFQLPKGFYVTSGKDSDPEVLSAPPEPKSTLCTMVVQKKSDGVDNFSQNDVLHPKTSNNNREKFLYGPPKKRKIIKEKKIKSISKNCHIYTKTIKRMAKCKKNSISAVVPKTINQNFKPKKHSASASTSLVPVSSLSVNEPEINWDWDYDFGSISSEMRVLQTGAHFNSIPTWEGFDIVDYVTDSDIEVDNALVSSFT